MELLGGAGFMASKVCLVHTLQVLGATSMQPNQSLELFFVHIGTRDSLGPLCAFAVARVLFNVLIRGD